MNSFYMKIEISKALQDKKETICYYIIKDEQYGVKVTKALENTMNNEEIIMRDNFENEDDAKLLIESLVENGTDFSQIEYVVEDYKNAKNLSKTN